MARYIDACSLRDKVSESLKNNSHKVDIVARNHNIEHALFLMLIADEPTADVQEVKHGKWKIIVDDYGCEYMWCSCCKEEFYNAEYVPRQQFLTQSCKMR